MVPVGLENIGDVNLLVYRLENVVSDIAAYLELKAEEYRKHKRYRKVRQLRFIRTYISDYWQSLRRAVESSRDRDAVLKAYGSFYHAIFMAFLAFESELGFRDADKLYSEAMELATQLVLRKLGC